MTPDAPHLLDARGILCPLPVLKLQKILKTLPPGAQVRVLATDPMAKVDIPHFCHEAGHIVREAANAPEGYATFLIEKRGLIEKREIIEKLGD